jgi:hypothetical protein
MFNVQYDTICDRINSLFERFPINKFVHDDPFLPWMHDYFVADIHNPDEDTTNGGEGAEQVRRVPEVRIIAQNKRRCDTGEGKEK